MVPGSRLFSFHRVTLIAFALVCLAVVGHCSPAHCLATSQAGETNPVDCSQSNQMHDSDATIMRFHEAPTHFRLMTSRYFAMVRAVRGYQCTGTVTVGFDGYHYFQTARGDDPGLMELVPTLARLTGLSLAAAYDLTILLTATGGHFHRLCCLLEAISRSAVARDRRWDLSLPRLRRSESSRRIYFSDLSVDSRDSLAALSCTCPKTPCVNSKRSRACVLVLVVFPA